jgi:hypothetical protein
MQKLQEIWDFPKRNKENARLPLEREPERADKTRTLSRAMFHMKHKSPFIPERLCAFPVLTRFSPVIRSVVRGQVFEISSQSADTRNGKKRPCISPVISPDTWQISGRANCTFADRVQLDVRYARGWSILGDLRIIVLTVPAVFGRRGAR